MGEDGNLKADLVMLFPCAKESMMMVNPGITAYSYGATPDKKGRSDDLLCIVFSQVRREPLNVSLPNDKRQHPVYIQPSKPTLLPIAKDLLQPVRDLKHHFRLRLHP